MSSVLKPGIGLDPKIGDGEMDTLNSSYLQRTSPRNPETKLMTSSWPGKKAVITGQELPKMAATNRPLMLVVALVNELENAMVCAGEGAGEGARLSRAKAP